MNYTPFENKLVECFSFLRYYETYLKIIFLSFRYSKHRISFSINNKLNWNSSRNVIIHREVNVLRLSLILIPTSVPLLPLLKQRLVSNVAGQSANSTVPIYSKYMKTSGKRAKHAGKGFSCSGQPQSRFKRIINISHLIFFLSLQKILKK